YGAYLNQLLTSSRAKSAVPADEALPDSATFGSGITCIQADSLTLTETAFGVTARLDDGRQISASRAVLATGHATPPEPAEGLTSAWDFTPPSSPDDEILIIGTGLSMVDHLMSLLRAGHRGKITSIS